MVEEDIAQLLRAQASRTIAPLGGACRCASPSRAAKAAEETRIHPQQRALAVLNVLGGLAVLGSYVYAFSYPSEIRAGLWGGVPQVLRPLYTTNMLLAAAGYFPFTVLFLFRTRPDEFQRVTGAPFGILFVLYGLVLAPSALWLPLTASMLVQPAALLWASIRFVLALVGIGAAGLLVLAFRFARARPGLAGWSAVLGALPFFTQTAILDATIWPVFFPG